MTGFPPKTYQSQVLESVEAYFQACHELPSPSIAYTATTERLCFLCQLPAVVDRHGAVLAIEYKGADRWTDAEDDRLIGGLWAELSNGHCRFAMVKEKRWDWIESLLE